MLLASAPQGLCAYHVGCTPLSLLLDCSYQTVRFDLPRDYGLHTTPADKAFGTMTGVSKFVKPVIACLLISQCAWSAGCHHALCLWQVSLPCMAYTTMTCCRSAGLCSVQFVCSCTQRLSVCLLCSTIIPEIQATAKPPVVKVWLDYGQMSMWSGLTLSLSLLLAFLDFESELHSLQTMNKAIWMLYVELAALYLPSAVSLRCHLAV